MQRRSYGCLVDERRLAILVGVGDGVGSELTSTANDVNDMQDFLSLPNYRFEVQPIRDSAATRGAVMDALESAAKNPPQALVFYFSGHGFQDAWGNAFLGTWGTTRPDDGLSIPILVQALEKLPPSTRLALAILDCCHSGTADGQTKQPFVTTQAIADAVKGYSPTRVVFAACQSDKTTESAIEAPNGAFTYHILEALNGGAVDDRGEVTVDGLVNYVRTRFRQETVHRGDSAGRYALGSGFLPVAATPLTRSQTADLRQEAKDLLHEYESYLGEALSDWSSRGYGDAVRTLRPVYEWFRRNEEKHRDLRNDPEFAKLKARLLSKRQHLQAMEPGQVFDGRIVVRELGTGGFGTVWLLADENDSSSTIALKVVSSGHLGDPTVLRMFDRGYRAMERLDHKRVVRVRGRLDVPYGFYMDYIPSEVMYPLQDDPGSAVRLLVLAAETIKHAHDSGVIHRDIKPQNMLVKQLPSGEILPYLTDFDLAWFSQASTIADRAMAALAFGAPEYLRAPTSSAARKKTVDTYSFAQLAYYVITMWEPATFQYAANISTFRRKLSEWSASSAATRMLEWYVSCTDPDPSKRPSDFTDVIAELVRVEAELGGDDEFLTRDRFLNELHFTLVGLPGERAVSTPSAFSSISGRTSISIEISGSGGDVKITEYELRVRFALSEITANQKRNSKARDSLNRRVDEALREFPSRPYKTYGQKGVYEVFVTIPRAVASQSGVQYARAVIHKVLLAIETM
jgi:serine/threonine protein kinase